MRFAVSFETGESKLPKDYRRLFISFLKTVFSKSGTITEILKKDKKWRPYTFTVYFGKNFEIKEEEIHTSHIEFFFSTGEPDLFILFYNGIIELKKTPILIGKQKFEIKNIKYLKQEKITKNRVLFKTLGISVLTDPDKKAKDFTSWFITPLDDIERFNQVLNKRTKEKFKYIKGIEPPEDLRMVPADKDSVKKDMVKHYGGYIKGFRGYFWLEGPPFLLQFVYDYGLGVRTGQGFGMLEILK